MENSNLGFNDCHDRLCWLNSLSGFQGFFCNAAVCRGIQSGLRQLELGVFLICFCRSYLGKRGSALCACRFQICFRDFNGRLS
jgi:hypothetical protein